MNGYWGARALAHVVVVDHWGDFPVYVDRVSRLAVLVGLIAGLENLFEDSFNG